MSESDKRIVQAAITDAREPDDIATEAMHSSDRARLCGCKSELAVRRLLQRIGEITAKTRARGMVGTERRLQLDRSRALAD